MTKASAKFAKMMREIKLKEALFKKMPKNRKRVAIAKDVIAQLETKQIIAVRGTYMRLREAPEARDGMQFRDALLSDKTTCTACAIGSMFACAVIRADALTIGDINEVSEASYIGTSAEIEDAIMREYLKRYFTDNQLAMIEAAFECWGAYSDTPGVRNSYFFGHEYGDVTERMIAIFRNIAANKGTFKPPRATAKMLERHDL